jgi:3'5'-cyclic nucleotide phosphodiesterase
VTMSCMKMLSRVRDDEAAPHTLGDGEYTKDITSDPLTQFAVVYAALIHDVDHAGVSNDQLVKEGARIAKMFRNKSVAENHSFQLSWAYLVSGEFKDLTDCICGGSEAELERFSTILLNVVLATDVFDKELKADREARWASVFSTDNNSNPVEQNYLKAQVVLEHLIQASDVAHTMQHWHIYRKWNERLFVEMTEAYKAGRLGKNPAEFWYEGEKGFLDFYVIPLAKKIGDCGVFGVSSDEFLTFAKANREEWELKGKDVVAELVKKYSPTVSPTTISE